MATSKTGWTCEPNGGCVAQADLCNCPHGLDDCKEKTVGPARRICVRIDECPETMTRAEAKEKIEAGWEIRFCDGLAQWFVTDTFSAVGDTVQCGVHDVELSTITAARPHSGAEWIKIVD